LTKKKKSNICNIAYRNMHAQKVTMNDSGLSEYHTTLAMKGAVKIHTVQKKKPPFFTRIQFSIHS